MKYDKTANMFTSLWSTTMAPRHPSDLLMEAKYTLVPPDGKIHESTASRVDGKQRTANRWRAW
jgi:hypothetical protein